jgi:Tol biopolymer transport system component
MVVRTVTLVFLLTSVAFTIAQSDSPAPPPAKQSKPVLGKLEVKEVTLGRIPKEMLFSGIATKRDAPGYWQAVDKIGREWLSRVAVSRDQKRVAVVVKRDGRSVVVVDGKEEIAFDDISAIPWFSPDSRRLAYVAKRGDLQCMVVDGVKGQSYEVWSGMYPIFSPDSKNVAYMARRGSNTVVVLGVSESKPYRGIRSETPPAIVFSPDSKRFAYAAELGDQKWTVVVDGAEGKVYDSVTIPVFSPDSSHVLHTARRGKNEFVVVDGFEGPPFSDINEGLFPFSPDGKRVAYQAQLTDGNYVLVADGQPSKPYEHIEFSASYFSPDSQHVVFAARKGNKVCVVLDGKESPDCDGIAEMPLFSPDSKHMAYAAAKGWSASMILDGVTGKKYGDIYHHVFSPDSKHLAYAAVRGLSAFVVQDGKEGPSHLLADVDGSLMEIVFSPNSKRLAYHISVAGRASRVVVDGTKSALYERIEHGSLKFSSDSKHVAYWAAPFSGEWRVYVDGLSTGKYDGALFRSELVFDGPDSLHALAQRGDQILRLDIKIPSSSR